ncbi:hypothetical protein AVEN_244746-1 [Araneus ventricosus]|uniref:Uncharacterized protein n=1 Tax=Araneus ventricosus TaxID=182803 RepID=A0A4Y2BS22_ARAVE|nr:hypothetical protein AVEN_244746-1 [Araneus ventricosus]
MCENYWTRYKNGYLFAKAANRAYFATIGFRQARVRLPFPQDQHSTGQVRQPALDSGAPNTSIQHSRSSWKTSNELEHLENKRIFQCPPLFLLPELRPSPKELSRNHDTRDCTSSYLVCINCDKSNDKDGTDHDIRHSAADHNCPSYKKEIFFYQKSVNY